MSEIPESMRAELEAWNDGDGISLDQWIGCVGNYKLAIGYLSLFWPKFVIVDDYILRDEGYTSEDVRAWEKDGKCNKQSIESTMNHLHIADIHYGDSGELSEDQIMFIGNKLKDMWAAKLKLQFPDRPCEVEFFEPDNRKDLVQFQISFWQKKHEQPI